MRRTGLKTLYRKVINFLKYPYNFFYESKTKFPKKPQSQILNSFWLHTLVSEIDDWKLNKTLGFLHNKPHPFSVNVWKKLLSLNTNNLGEWADRDVSKLSGTQKSENILISKMIDLLGGDKDKWGGYATSGATESNIFSAWMGRNSLKDKMPGAKICIILNQLTHYSIKKSADVIGVPSFEIGFDRDKWKSNPTAIKNKILELTKGGYKGFLIPLTLGYTQTGTNDDYIQITKLLNEIRKSKKIEIFIWIDAAINGLILPFTSSDFEPLRNPLINTFILDFHKTGLSPISSGLILYRSSYKKFVEQKVQYLDQNDNTLLGSRPGASPAAMLSVINSLGISGFKELIKNSIVTKNNFLLMVTSKGFDVEIINEKDGTALALVSKKPLPKEFVDKYGLFAKRWSYRFEKFSEHLYIYKINFI